jgi:hypothetical protein
MLRLLSALLLTTPVVFGQMQEAIDEAKKEVDLANTFIQETLSVVEGQIKSGQPIATTNKVFSTDVGGVKNPIASITYGIPTGLTCADASAAWSKDTTGFYPCLVAPNQLATDSGNVTTDCSNPTYPVPTTLTDGDTSYYSCNNNKLVIQVCFKSGLNSVMDDKCILFVGVTRSSPLIDFQDPDASTTPVALQPAMDRITLFRCINPRGYANDSVNKGRPFGFIERTSGTDVVMTPVIKGLRTSENISLDLCFNPDN